jgi:hypothetical protein
MFDRSVTWQDGRMSYEATSGRKEELQPPPPTSMRQHQRLSISKIASLSKLSKPSDQDLLRLAAVGLPTFTEPPRHYNELPALLQSSSMQDQQTPAAGPASVLTGAHEPQNATGDKLLCQWDRCGEHCASPKALYVSKAFLLSVGFLLTGLS